MASYRGSDEVGQVARIEDLSLKTLIDLVARLKETETPEQFLCREMEMDQAYFWADTDWKDAQRDEAGEGAIEDLWQVRQHVLSAHDHVGENNLRAAMDELNQIIERKIGL